MQLQYLDLMEAMGQPEGHTGPWRWLGERLPQYPTDRRYWAWSRAKRADRRRPIAMVGGSPAVRSDDSAYGIAALRILTGTDLVTIRPDDPEGMARAAARALFRDSLRRTSLVVDDGSAWLLESLIAHCVPTWVEDGYVITPLLGGHLIKGLIVRHGRQRWTLATSGR